LSSVATTIAGRPDTPLTRLGHRPSRWSASVFCGCPWTTARGAPG